MNLRTFTKNGKYLKLRKSLKIENLFRKEFCDHWKKNQNYDTNILKITKDYLNDGKFTKNFKWLLKTDNNDQFYSTKIDQTPLSLKLLQKNSEQTTMKRMMI